MFGRILIIIVALQLIMTSAFAHTMMMPDYCSMPTDQHMQVDVSGETYAQGDVDLNVQDQHGPMDLLHCAGSTCTNQMGSEPLAVLSMNFRSADLKHAEPRMALQSVLLFQLRPPLLS